MARKGRSGAGGIKGLVIGFLLAGTLLFVFMKAGGGSVNGILDLGKNAASNVEQFVKGLFGDVNVEWEEGITPGNNAPGTEVPASPSEAATALESLRIEPAKEIKYNRDEWVHWNSVGTSCWNVRDEVLYRQAEQGSVTLLDKNKNVTTDKGNACSISGGTWVDPYTGKTFTNPADLDIDHVIPLGYAARHGGQDWGLAKKEQYANSLDDGHLLAVFSSANRQKSDKGPGAWKPQKSYQCSYAKNWINVSQKWDLSIEERDKVALQEMLSTCA